MRWRVLVVVASATEARSLVPVIEELDARAAHVDVFDAGRTGVANAAAELPPPAAPPRMPEPPLISHFARAPPTPPSAAVVPVACRITC